MYNIVIIYISCAFVALGNKVNVTICILKTSKSVQTEFAAVAHLVLGGTILKDGLDDDDDSFCCDVSPKGQSHEKHKNIKKIRDVTNHKDNA